MFGCKASFSSYSQIFQSLYSFYLLKKYIFNDFLCLVVIICRNKKIFKKIIIKFPVFRIKKNEKNQDSINNNVT